MSKHNGHKLVYVLEACTVEIPVTITDDGDVAHKPQAQYSITDYDGEAGVWCNDCDERIYGGEHGLSEVWQVV